MNENTKVDQSPMKVLAGFLFELASLPVENSLFRKYFYPSAGSLYPVQLYLQANAELFESTQREKLSSSYYFNPEDFSLVATSGKNCFVDADNAIAQQLKEDKTEFLISLVADISAIAPMYGGLSQSFSELESGYMTKVLVDSAKRHQLTLSLVDNHLISRKATEDAYSLGEQHILIQSIAVRRQTTPVKKTAAIKPAQVILTP